MMRRLSVPLVLCALFLGCEGKTDTPPGSGPSDGQGRNPDAGLPDGGPGPSGALDGGGQVPEQLVPTAYEVCSRDRVCWELPAPQGHTMHGAHALSGDDIWLVGEYGSVVHYDGRTFRREPVDTTATLRAVDASGPGNVWVVGDGGVTLQFDGEQWITHDLQAIVDGSKGNMTGDLHGVVALSPTAVWVVGYSGVGGVAGFYDGETWQDQSLGIDTENPLRAVWGGANDDLWAVGDHGTIRHFDGAAWDRMMSPTGEDLRAVHGASADEVWIVGANATAVRWDGSRLRMIRGGLAGELHAVVVDGVPPPEGAFDDQADADGSSLQPTPRVWAFGAGGRLYRYDDRSWSAFTTGLSQDLLSAARISQGEMLATGQSGIVQHYRDSQRRTLSYGSDRTRMALFGMPDGELWSVGDEVLRATAEGWAPIETSGARSLFDVWGDGNRLWAVGTAGTVLRFDDQGSEDVSPPEVAGAWLRGVWGHGDDLWVVGTDGVAARKTGSDWTKVEVASGTDLLGVWGTAQNDAWIVGNDATTLHWNGGTWIAIPTPGEVDNSASLRAVWGTTQSDLWAVGSLGTIMHWDGSVWSATEPLGNFTLNDVWGPAPDDVYAVGTGGTLLHFDGEAWSPLDSGTARSLEALGPGPDGQVRIAGRDGTLLVIRGD